RGAARMSAAPQLAIRSARPAQQRRRGVVAELIADQAVLALLHELAAWPKPGLVSHVDSGSHTDMNAAMLQASAEALRPFFAELARAGQDGANMDRLRSVGLRAEVAMLAITGGINTHRGAIFGLGLLCAAAGAKAGGLADPMMPLGNVVVRLWGRSILDGPVLLHSHGGKARRHYGANGARAEAAQGFLSVYEVGLPALQWGALIAPGDAEAARVQACFALIASLEDTNLLHRGGMSGLRDAQCAARVFLDDGGVGTCNWRKRANVVHQSFVARRLSPGGSADLLAMTLFIQACEAEFFSCRR
ncbi:MAG TPA: triphosphoribosyl-dephospho-CoA synthase MdcB, partial [Ktedonobacterales bacterium]|nr:triphosphoribosyl-dephospho-CoA synthase MdcB [Ktedonobacterales bacterium]